MCRTAREPPHPAFSHLLPHGGQGPDGSQRAGGSGWRMGAGDAPAQDALCCAAAWAFASWAASHRLRRRRQRRTPGGSPPQAVQANGSASAGWWNRSLRHRLSPAFRPWVHIVRVTRTVLQVRERWLRNQKASRTRLSVEAAPPAAPVATATGCRHFALSSRPGGSLPRTSHRTGLVVRTSGSLE